LFIYKSTWYCRWDGKQYRPLKETDRDGFCCPACKQAHHRAYKKYIECALRQKSDLKMVQPGARIKSNAKKRKKKVS